MACLVSEEVVSTSSELLLGFTLEGHPNRVVLGNYIYIYKRPRLS